MPVTTTTFLCFYRVVETRFLSKLSTCVFSLGCFLNQSNPGYTSKHKGKIHGPWPLALNDSPGHGNDAVMMTMNYGDELPEAVGMVIIE